MRLSELNGDGEAPDKGEKSEKGENSHGGRLRFGPKLPGDWEGLNEFDLWDGDPDMEVEIMPRKYEKGYGGEFRFKF